MFIYAETALHHEGNLDYLIQLIDCAAEAGADGVKFQVTLNHDEVMSTRHSMYDLCKSMLLLEEEWIQIFNYTIKKDLKIILMPCDQQTMLRVLDNTFEPHYLDLHSVSFYDNELLSLIKSSRLPLILAIGGRTGSELEKKFIYFGDQIYCIMVGFQSFPTNFKDLNIEKINKLKKQYPNTKIGYADHTKYADNSMIENNLYALGLGSTIFEKHITIEEGVERIDYISAVGIKKFSMLIKELKNVKKIRHTNIDVDLNYLSKSEIQYRNREKFAVAAKSLKKGDLISKNTIKYKLIDSGIGFTPNDIIPNSKINRHILYDDIILESDFYKN